MTWLLTKLPIQSLLLYLLSRLYQINAEQWHGALQVVKAAAQTFTESEDKKAYVLAGLHQLFPELRDAARNFLTEAAVAYLKDRKLIQ